MHSNRVYCAMLLGLCVACSQHAAAPSTSEPLHTVSDRDASRRWLAGDHHIHSRYSVRWDSKAADARFSLGGDASYPIALNALMARRYGLDWMVTTDHGSRQHAKIQLELGYPELLVSREEVPEVLQFYGLEMNTPAADHSTWIMPRHEHEAEQLYELESRYDIKDAHPRDPARDREERMLDALRDADALDPKPIVIANHPSRSARGLGRFGEDEPRELRAWNDAAPRVAVGMEGAPGHQAAALLDRKGVLLLMRSFADKLAERGLPAELPRGVYYRHPTHGGFDQMTAVVGGVWDSMLGEGRRFWITATSDSHSHYSEGGVDFWPGEYSKTWVWAEKNYASVLEGLREGRVFVSTGDLVTELNLSAHHTATGARAETGGALSVRAGEAVEFELSFFDPSEPNAGGRRPQVARVDLIRGPVEGPVARRDTHEHPGTRVVRRFERDEHWREGAMVTLRHRVEPVVGSFYLRVRLTNTNELEPEPDPGGEDPWTDLWAYSNPIFIDVLP